MLTPPRPSPSHRAPTPAEEAIFRDKETEAVFAARKAATAKSAADRLRWVTARREASAAAAEYAAGKGIAVGAGVPPDPVVTGDVVPASRVDDLVRARGIDGQTARKARRSVAGISSEALAGLAGLFAVLGASEEGEGEETPQEPVGALWGEAVEAPGPDVVTVAVVAKGLSATLRAHVVALGVLADGDFMVEVGPYGPRWAQLVAGVGSWVRGPSAEVERFLTAWRKVAHSPGGLGIAPWRNRA